MHRNSQKRYYEPNAAYFTVTKTFKNIPYFKEPIFCDLFIEELKLCKKLKKFKLLGFCLIYDHLNLLIQPGEKFNISKVMQSIKKEFSRDANVVLEGDIPECRLRGQQRSKRFKKDFTIPNLFNYRKQFILKYGQNQCKIPKFKWQKSFHDHVIRDQQDLENHYIYTAYNFQKHNLPEDWKYTSLSYKDLVDGID
jgi:REP element-mobilizing transposase RayT